MQKCKDQGVDDCGQDNDSRSSMEVRGGFTGILIRLQILFINCYLFKCGNFFSQKNLNCQQEGP